MFGKNSKCLSLTPMPNFYHFSKRGQEIPNPVRIFIDTNTSEQMPSYDSWSAPNLFGPVVPFEHAQTKSRISPTIGTKKMKSHQPERSTSCKRRIDIPIPGNRRTKVAMILAIPRSMDVPESMIVAKIFTKKTNKVHHQYSDLAERPSKSTYLLKPDEIACPMFIVWFSISQFNIHRTISRFGHDLQPQITPTR